MSIETDSSSEKFTPKALYEKGVKRLLEKNDFRGDGHYEFKDINIITPEGATKSGKYILTDYFSWEIDTKTDGTPNDTERKFLLEEKKAIVDVKFCDEEKNHVEQYLLFDPKTPLRKGSIIKDLLTPEDPTREPLIKLPTDIEPGPIIVAPNYTVLQEPHKDKQLQELYSVWTKPKEESSPPSPSA